jgi:hypothetical protein
VLSCSAPKDDSGSFEPGRLRDGLLEPAHRLVDGLGVAEGLCQPRAQAVEQNGSPFLTAISGRSLPQLGQRPPGNTGGSALSEG